MYERVDRIAGWCHPTDTSPLGVAGETFSEPASTLKEDASVGWFNLGTLRLYFSRVKHTTPLYALPLSYR